MATEPVIPDDILVVLLAALPIDSAPAAREALDAIPDGWAKVGGEWVRLVPFGKAGVTCAHGNRQAYIEEHGCI